jgi:hypothetical protein
MPSIDEVLARAAAQPMDGADFVTTTPNLAVIVLSADTPAPADLASADSTAAGKSMRDDLDHYKPDRLVRSRSVTLVGREKEMPQFFRE